MLVRCSRFEFHFATADCPVRPFLAIQVEPPRKCGRVNFRKQLCYSRRLHLYLLSKPKARSASLCELCKYKCRNTSLASSPKFSYLGGSGTDNESSVTSKTLSIMPSDQDSVKKKKRNHNAASPTDAEVGKGHVDGGASPTGSGDTTLAILELVHANNEHHPMNWPAWKRWSIGE